MNEPRCPHCRQMVHATHEALCPWEGEVLPGQAQAPMAVQISQAEQDHHADLRRASYQLALQRRHVQR